MKLKTLLVFLLLAPLARPQVVAPGVVVLGPLSASGGGGGGSGTVTSIAPADSSLTFAPNPITGTGTIAINLANPQTWTGIQTFTTPVLGAATATTINGVTIPSVTDTAAVLGTAQTFSAVESYSGNVQNLSTSVTKWFNTATLANEYFSAGWSSNVFSMGPVTGSGTNRAFNLVGIFGGKLTLTASVAGQLTWLAASTSTANSSSDTWGGTDTATSGTENAHVFYQTWNQASGTASNTVLKVQAVETAVGSGTQNLQTWFAGTTGATLEASMNNKGVLAASGLGETGATFAGTVTLTAGAGTITSAAISVSSCVVLTLKTASGASVYPQVTANAGSATIAGASTDAGTYNWRVIQ